MIQSFLQSMLMFSIILTPIYVLARFIYMRKRQISWGREATMFIFFAFCVSIFSQTILPEVTLHNGRLQVALRPNQWAVNLIPFKTISTYMNALQGPLASIAFYNLVGNIVLFIPFGFFLPFLWEKFRKVQAAALYAIGIPVFIETTQYFIGRSVDIDDVILNTIAIMFGYLLWIVTKKRLNFASLSKKGCNE